MSDTRTQNTRIKDAIEEIVSDISDRRGIGNEWEQIDDDVQAEIKEKWYNILDRNFSQPITAGGMK